MALARKPDKVEERSPSPLLTARRQSGRTEGVSILECTDGDMPKLVLAAKALVFETKGYQKHGFKDMSFGEPTKVFLPDFSAWPRGTTSTLVPPAKARPVIRPVVLKLAGPAPPKAAHIPHVVPARVLAPQPSPTPARP